MLPRPIVPVVGNPVVESTVIVVAILVRAPFNNVLTALLPVGLTSALISILSKKA